MYKCRKCAEESDFPTECCGRKMKCDICQGAGCVVCEEDKDYSE